MPPIHPRGETCGPQSSPQPTLGELVPSRHYLSVVENESSSLICCGSDSFILSLRQMLASGLNDVRSSVERINHSLMKIWADGKSVLKVAKPEWVIGKRTLNVVYSKVWLTRNGELLRNPSGALQGLPLIKWLPLCNSNFIDFHGPSYDIKWFSILFPCCLQVFHDAQCNWNIYEFQSESHNALEIFLD